MDEGKELLSLLRRIAEAAERIADSMEAEVMNDLEVHQNFGSLSDVPR